MPSRHFASASTQWARTGLVPPAEPFTMACWAYIENTTTVMTLMAFANTSSANEYHSILTASGAIRAQSQHLVGSGASVSAAYTANKFLHVAGVWKSAASRQIFLNGVPATIDTTSVSPTGLNEVSLGNQVVNTLYLNGMIDFPTWWADALTPGEIFSMFCGKDPRKVRPNAIYLTQQPISRTNVGSAEFFKLTSKRLISPLTMPLAATTPFVHALYPDTVTLNTKLRRRSPALLATAISIPLPPKGKPPKPPGPPPGKGPKDKSALELSGLNTLLQTQLFPPISYRPKFPIFALPPVHLPPPKRVTTLRHLMSGTASPKTAQKKFILGEVPPSAGSGEEIHGPGWKLFGHHLDGYHPPSKRAPKAETLERDLQRAYNRANDIEDEDDRREAVREIKATAATALSVGKKSDDQRLVALAQQIIALKALKLQADIYLERVGLILASQAPEADDMEALMFMAQFV